MVNNRIIEILGLGSLPRSEQEAVLARVMDDSLITTKSAALARNAFLVQAVEGLHGLELRALIKRVSPQIDAASPWHWTLQKTRVDDDGAGYDSYSVQATCGRCKQVQVFLSPTPYQTLSPEEIAHRVQGLRLWHGCTKSTEQAPDNISAEWRSILERYLRRAVSM